MDIEQLKLVLEMVKGVSGDAQTVAVLWLVLDKLLPIIAWMIAGCGAYKLLKIVLVSFSYEPDFRKLRDALGVGCRGHLTSDEHDATMSKLLELIREKNG